jgi:hypothetical protein
MKEILLTILFLGILYWYFNIRGLRKCVIILEECNDIKCHKFSTECTDHENDVKL